MVIEFFSCFICDPKLLTIRIYGFHFSMPLRNTFSILDFLLLGDNTTKGPVTGELTQRTYWQRASFWQKIVHKSAFAEVGIGQRAVNKLSGDATACCYNCRLMKTYCKELPANANNPTASFQRVTTCCQQVQRARQRAEARDAMGS